MISPPLSAPDSVPRPPARPTNLANRVRVPPSSPRPMGGGPRVRLTRFAVGLDTIGTVSIRRPVARLLATCEHCQRGARE